MQGVDVMLKRFRWSAVGLAAVALAALVAIAASTSASAQVKYDSGQDVQPGFDGWVRNADGTADLYFGYLNRNYVEEPSIPVGPNNNVTPDGPDRGQPTYFLPRRQRYVFTVRVPKDWDPKREVIWTLTHRGRTNKIFGALNPEDEIVEHNVLTYGSFSSEAPGHVETNQPPTVTAKSVAAVTLPATLDLVATATDDGLPMPRVRKTIVTRDKLCGRI